MAINVEILNELYDQKDGEPSGLHHDVWNGRGFQKQRELFDKIANERDHKVRFRLLVECFKMSIVFQDEMNKANFYKNEFDAMANFLDTNGLLHNYKNEDTATDSKGIEHQYTIAIKRSIAKSIPQLRPIIAKNA